jgi:hypothetical protein
LSFVVTGKGYDNSNGDQALAVDRDSNQPDNGRVINHGFRCYPSLPDNPCRPNTS